MYALCCLLKNLGMRYKIISLAVEFEGLAQHLYNIRNKDNEFVIAPVVNKVYGEQEKQY